MGPKIAEISIIYGLNSICCMYAKLGTGIIIFNSSNNIMSRVQYFPNFIGRWRAKGILGNLEHSYADWVSI